MANAEDAELLLGFLQKLNQSQDTKEPLLATEERLRTLIITGKAHALFGEVQGQPISFMFFSQTASAFTGKLGVFLDGFWIDPDMRHRGYGKTMMEYMAKYTLENGFNWLEWGCLSTDLIAIKFYNYLGASCIAHYQCVEKKGRSKLRVYRFPTKALYENAERFGLYSQDQVKTKTGT